MMKRIFVKDWMTTDPITINANTKLPKAHRIMDELNIHRLPVMENGELIGILTFGDVRAASSSETASLSQYEMDYLLSDTDVTEVMTREPMCVSSDAKMSDVIKVLMEENISGFPVVDDGVLVGVITATDIFKAAIQLFNQQGK